MERRIYEHKQGIIEGFTKQYTAHNLVHYEETADISSAIQREKLLKSWNRKWKIALIEKENPLWNDLSKDWTREDGSSGQARG